MSQRQFGVLVVVVAVSGILGGGLVELVLGHQLAYAQGGPQEALQVKRLSAEQIVVAPPGGKGSLNMMVDQFGKPSIQMIDGDSSYATVIAARSLGLAVARRLEPGHGTEQGVHGRVALGLGDQGEPELRLFDQDGETIWVAP
jgi:hypothetical protein